VISGDVYPTLSSVIPLYNLLNNHIAECLNINKGSAEFMEMCETAKSKLKEYYNKVNIFSTIATALDPR
jgi:hypothetical protein